MSDGGIVSCVNDPFLLFIRTYTLRFPTYASIPPCILEIHHQIDQYILI